MAIIGLLADIAVLILTAYTLYITAFSHKVELISSCVNYPKFEGYRSAMTLMNKSLHAIPIQGVFLLKQKKDCFKFIQYVTYSDPIVIGSWSMCRIETDAITSIRDWNEKPPNSIMLDDIVEDAIIGIESGQRIIWVNPCKNKHLREAKRAYKNNNFDSLTIHKTTMYGLTISEAVNCVINIRLKEINNTYVLHTVFGIAEYDKGKSVLLSDPICGYRTLPCPGESEEEILKTIQGLTNIPKEDIVVEKFGKSTDCRTSSKVFT